MQNNKLHINNHYIIVKYIHYKHFKIEFILNSYIKLNQTDLIV